MLTKEPDIRPGAQDVLRLPYVMQHINVSLFLDLIDTSPLLLLCNFFFHSYPFLLLCDRHDTLCEYGLFRGGLVGWKHSARLLCFVFGCAQSIICATLQDDNLH